MGTEGIEADPTETPDRGPGRWLVWAVLLGAIGVFVWGWSDYGWHLYLSLRLPAFDFGINYQNIWAAAHGTQLDFFGIGIGSFILYAFVPAYWVVTPLPKFILFLIVFQAAWLAAGAIPLYLVAFERLRNRGWALALALAYLFFPAMVGSLWFPFHYEALFPTLFLLGYWQYRRASYFWASVCWTAALFTHIGGDIVIGFFAVGMLLEPRLGGWVNRRRGGARPVPSGDPAGPPSDLPSGRRRLHWGRESMALFLFVASLALFAILAVTYGWMSFVHYVTKSGVSDHGYSTSIFVPLSVYNLPNQGWTLLLLFGPVLGLAFLGREERWAMIPYLGAVMLFASPVFQYPFRFQYATLLVPPMFAASLRGIERLSGVDLLPRPAPRASFAQPSRRWSLRGRPGVACGAILVTVFVTGLVFAPWGPGNPLLLRHPFLAPGYFDDSRVYGTNLTLDGHIQELINALPRQGALLTQVNLGQSLDRQYYIFPSRTHLGDPITLVLTDPYNIAFYRGNLNGPGTTPMVDWANSYLAQGFGVYGEADGAVVLEANYTGARKVFHPIDQWFGPAAFGCCSSNASWNGTDRTNWVQGPQTPFDGNYAVFSPGNYQVTVAMTVHHPRPTDRMVLQASGEYGKVHLARATISAVNWTSVDGVVTFTVPFTVESYVLQPLFTLFIAHWTGALQFGSLHLEQMG